MVPTDKRAPRAAADALLSRVIFHDGRLVRRPDPKHALFALFYLPVGFAIALLRVFVSLYVPRRLIRHAYRLTGIRLAVRGTPCQEHGSLKTEINGRRRRSVTKTVR